MNEHQQTTEKQKAHVENKTIEEHYSIRFVIGADKYKYRTLIEEMKNNVLKKNFPKTIAEASHVLSKWNKQSRCNYNGNRNEWNEGIVFATAKDEK